IIGYSLNDTIIVMDRIRENRGRLPYATDKVVNLSINQTISRTVITSGTTLLALMILYTSGGEGVRGFAYAMLIGVGIGTYSSIAVAAPLVWSSKRGGKSIAAEIAEPRDDASA
ncbi:MAG: protein translocase subunit SecDF, partial [Planctomycetota bacterium]